MLRAASFAGASAFMTSSPLIAKLSQSDAGAFDFSIISATLFAELAKLAFSLGALLALGALRRHAHGGSVLRALRSLCPLSPLAFGKYSVPSLVYALNNNLVLHILTLISPTLFQVFACLKTIMTGALMHCTGMKRLSPLQVAAVSLLACAVFIVSADPGTSCAASASSDSPLRDATGEGDRTTTGDAARGHAQRNVLIGLSLTLVANGLSTLGGVCCEWLLKEPTQRPLSLHWQNAQIYVWGSVINAAALLLGEACGGVRGGALLRGYSAAAWCLVANNAAVGLCTSAVLKLQDNVARVFAHGVAMVGTLALSVILFHQALSPRVVAAIWVVGASGFIFHSSSSNELNSERAQGSARRSVSVAAEPSHAWAANLQDDRMLASASQSAARADDVAVQFGPARLL
ncbi:hypothetical protein KFE25_013870 [Diacronema lutheri]|uniref:UDP-galactose transporter n=1 Tax=Diacronema lutheri TaxID=2081491 RepID=A0A8J5XAH3_DIALT|nr:hypothetical protein KFE25_013870 [Diacronema lutheri]